MIAKLSKIRPMQVLLHSLLAALLIACQPGEEATGALEPVADSARESAINRNQSSVTGPAGPRVVVIGDLHADLDVTRQVFRLAAAIDVDDEWIGGDLTIVQLGDLIGRSDDDRQVLDFIFNIRGKAAAGGGVVHVLIGNHEVFGARVDNQAVGRNPFSAFEDMSGLALDDRRLRRLPENQRARGAALMAGGPYAVRLAEFPAVLQLGDTVFAHGGVTPRWAEYGVDKINQEVRDWFLGKRNEPDSTLGVDNGDRVMWTRQFSYNVDFYDCEILAESLRILGAKRMVVAHTVHPEITARCDNSLWAVDVGMSRAYGGAIQLLEIMDDQELRVIRP